MTSAGGVTGLGASGTAAESGSLIGSSILF